MGTKGDVLAAAADPRIWRRLVPGLPVVRRRRLAPYAVPAALPPACVEQVRAEGYFQTPRIVPARAIRPLAAAVETLAAIGLPPLFALAYDRLHEIVARLEPVFGPVLGSGFRLVPSFYVWRVGGDGEDAGYAPHRDAEHGGALREDGRPTLLTVWIPITDATPLSSCMYVLPTDRDPNVTTEKRGYRGEAFDLQDVRALPAPAGSVLGWSQYLLHWGGRASPRAPAPRVSVGLYLQSGDLPPFDDHVRDVDPCPPLRERLRFIARGMRYSRKLLDTPLLRFVERYE